MGTLPCILGQVDITMSARGYLCKPTESKVQKWTESIKKALLERRLVPGEASKLAGWLSWGSSNLFRYMAPFVCVHICLFLGFACRKLGRAMLRPIHDQKTRRDGQVSCELQRAQVVAGGPGEWALRA